MTKEIMTIDELAKYLQISKATLYMLLMRRKIPGRKVGKRWRFHKDTIDQWFKEREISAVTKKQ